MNIEDLIIALAFSYQCKLTAWDEKLIYSFAEQITRGVAFTEKQAALALTIAKRNKAKLSAHFGKDISDYINSPQYRLGIRQINTERQITIADDPIYNKVIKVKFPYNEEQVAAIRKIKSQLNGVTWNADEKAWHFSLSEESICFLMEFIKDQPFNIDEEFQNYSDQINVILQNIDQYVPMLVAEKNALKFVNNSQNMPKIEAESVVKSLFHARKCGIFIWDDQVEQQLISADVDPVIVKFLKSSPSTPFQVNCETTSIFSLAALVQHMSPCLFVVPGGSELEKLDLGYTFLKSIDVADSDISVMFRLPNDTNNSFNKFVKEHQLNSAITENTKIVFISSKLPKTVLKSKIQFNSVINLGFSGVHYTIRDYVGTHHNLVYFSENKKQKEFNFGYM
jgi:hypothetical protein